MTFLANKKSVILLAILTAFMAFVVMGIVNPMIDGKNGLSVIALQLSFDKAAAKEIVSTWDIEAFREWIFTDYIYALSYVLFFASLLLWLGKEKHVNVKRFVAIALFAGMFDWVENSLELWFLKDTKHFSSTLFFIHSVLSTLKWLALPVVLWKIVKLVKLRGGTMNFTWINEIQDIDWKELSNLYRIAPLGEKHPKDLEKVFSNSLYIYFVYDKDRLIGAGRALADGVDCSYLCDVAVHPDYQGKGLGKELIFKLIEASKSHKKILLYSVPGKEVFYEKFGFKKMKTAMAIFSNQEQALAWQLIGDEL